MLLVAIALIGVGIGATSEGRKLIVRSRHCRDLAKNRRAAVASIRAHLAAGRILGFAGSTLGPPPEFWSTPEGKSRVSKFADKMESEEQEFSRVAKFPWLSLDPNLEAYLRSP
jgi:hypothetical protein